MKKLLSGIVILTAFMVLSSCGSRSVTRVSPNETIDLSGRWNDSDSKMVADEMIGDIFSARWLTEHLRSSSARPVVVVGLISNKSHEHINAETFIKDIERAVVQNGNVRLVVAGDKRDDLRRERADQQDFASMESMKKWGMELGADYILQGSINSIVDSYKKEKVVLYQVDLQLTNIQTNEVVWVGDKKIKKSIRDRIF